MAEPQALHAALLAASAPLLAGEQYSVGRLAGPLTALRAVVELHKPREVRFVGDHGAEPATQCGECADRCHSRSGLGCEYPGSDALYPCSTIQVIAEHLQVWP